MSHQVLLGAENRRRRRRLHRLMKGTVTTKLVSAVRTTTVRGCKKAHIEDVIGQVMSDEDTWQGYKRRRFIQ